MGHLSAGNHEHYAAVCPHCWTTVTMVCMIPEGISMLIGQMTIHFVENHWTELQETRKQYESSLN